MMRTTIFWATIAVAVTLSWGEARAQYYGPVAPATPGYSPVVGMPAYPVMPAGHMLSDCASCDGGGCDGCTGGCDGCDGGGCNECDGCSTCGGSGCRHCANPGFLAGVYWPFYGHWGSASYMMAWTRGRSVPPLATTSPLGTPRDEAGVLGFADTEILFGNDTIGDGIGNGLLLDLGGWLDPHHQTGLGMRFLTVSADSPNLGGGSDQYPILATPFFDVNSGEFDSVLANYPDELDGRLDVESDLDVLSYDAYLRAMIHRGAGYRVDILGGYQWSRIDDGLTVHTVTTSLPGDSAPGVVPGTVFDVWDSFDARNTFNGGTLGFLGEFYHKRWTLTALGKFGVGNMHHRIQVRGRNVISVPGQDPLRRNGGLLTQTSNIGTYEADQIAFIPEANLTLGYNVTCNLKLTVGCNFMYWSRVALAGDHIDLRVDPLQQVGLPGDFPDFPGILDTDFWLIGATFGAEARF